MKNLRNFISKHDERLFGLGLLLAFLLVASFIYGYVHHLQTKARYQAVARAKKMDGRTFTITAVAHNFVGDTQLFLTDENGKDAGWISMYMTNPFNQKINPLFLAFSNPNGRLPLPMKVRTLYRPDPWKSPHYDTIKDNFTGSYLEFEIL